MTACPTPEGQAHCPLKRPLPSSLAGLGIGVRLVRPGPCPPAKPRVGRAECSGGSLAKAVTRGEKQCTERMGRSFSGTLHRDQREVGDFNPMQLLEINLIAPALALLPSKPFHGGPAGELGLEKSTDPPGGLGNHSPADPPELQLLPGLMVKRLCSIWTFLFVRSN